VLQGPGACIGLHQSLEEAKAQRATSEAVKKGSPSHHTSIHLGNGGEPLEAPVPRPDYKGSEGRGPREGVLEVGNMLPTLVGVVLVVCTAGVVVIAVVMVRAKRQRRGAGPQASAGAGSSGPASVPPSWLHRGSSSPLSRQV
jgi:hypothetical protein